MSTDVLIQILLGEFVLPEQHSNLPRRGTVGAADRGDLVLRKSSTIENNCATMDIARIQFSGIQRRTTS